MIDELRLGRERRFLVLLGIICLALIGGALYMQVVLGEAPCPLCILQRYALLLIAIFAFIGAAMRTTRSVTVNGRAPRQPPGACSFSL
jgi:protein dithiol:quinone oxidoreductase